MLDAFLAVGEIIRPQGLHGELKIKPLTDSPDRFFDLKRIRLNGAMRALHCLRVQEGFAYVRLEGVYSRDAADALRGTLLYVPREEAVPLPEDAAYICDLIGCAAVDTEGVSHGVLADVLQPGGVDVYVFRGERGELMVPALKRTVLSVDVNAKHILLDAQGLRETAVYA